MDSGVLNPALVAAEGFNRSVFKSETSVEDEMWLTLDQLQGPQFLNSKDHALALVEAGELEERPHEFSSLAQRGIKQYVFCFDASPRAWDQGGKLHALLF